MGLAERGYKCTGYDLTLERVEAAKARARRARVSVELKQGDATNLPRNRKFDAVIALYILFLLPDDEHVKGALRRIRDLLSPRGVLVCNYYNPFTTGKTWLSEVMKRNNRIDEARAPGIRITDIEKLAQFDPVQGVAWVDETSVIEVPKGRHVFRDRERVRLFTYWDLMRYLGDAGFKEIESYPDWEQKQKKKPKAEQVVFVARK